MRPRLTFFCELRAEALAALFADKAVIAALQDLGAEISLGILDFSDQRAEVVQRLNRAGIPVTAWLLLPPEQGYRLGVDNAPQAANRYRDFKQWTEQNRLLWSGVGLDIRWRFSGIQNWVGPRWRTLPLAFRRLFQSRRFQQARKIYANLVEQIRSDGYVVESYTLPFVADERKAWSRLLQRLAGVVSLATDREVMMLYTSYFRPNGPGVLWSYGAEAEAIALGSTGGENGTEDVESEPLSWDELSRDLAYAWYWCNDLYIFSLEGCVRQGFLEKMRTFDWGRPIIEPEGLVRRVQAWRARLQTGLWAGSHLTVFLLLLAGFLLAFAPLRRRLQRG